MGEGDNHGKDKPSPDFLQRPWTTMKAAANKVSSLCLAGEAEESMQSQNSSVGVFVLLRQRHYPRAS